MLRKGWKKKTIEIVESIRVEKERILKTTIVLLSIKKLRTVRVRMATRPKLGLKSAWILLGELTVSEIKRLARNKILSDSIALTWNSKFLDVRISTAVTKRSRRQEKAIR